MAKKTFFYTIATTQIISKPNAMNYFIRVNPGKKLSVFIIRNP